MPSTIGIVGGLGPEGTVHYYRKLVALLSAPPPEERARLVVDHVWIERFAALLRAGAEEEIARLLGGSLERLHRAGADVALVAAVTPHKFLPLLRERSPLPIVDLVEATRRELVSARLRTVALLGTRATVTDPFFRRPLEEAGIRVVVPDGDAVAWLDAFIFGPLAAGEKTDAAKARVAAIVGDLAAGAPLDAVVVACTDLMELVPRVAPLVDPIDCHLRLALDALRDRPAARAPASG